MASASLRRRWRGSYLRWPWRSGNQGAALRPDEGARTETGASRMLGDLPVNSVGWLQILLAGHD